MVSVSSVRARGLNVSTAIKSPVIAASTGNLTLSAEQTVDGIALVAGDRVLAKDQTTATEIGIYLVGSGTWAREPDWDGSGDIVEGTLVPVSRGTANSDTMWRVTNTGTITVGTTSITMAEGLTKVAIAATSTVIDESADTTCFPIFVASATGDLALLTGTNLTFNSNTGSFAATVLVSSGAATIGGLATMSSNATVAGTLTGSGTVACSSSFTVAKTATISSNIGISGTATLSSFFAAGSIGTTNPAVLGRVYNASGTMTISTG